MGRFPGHYIVIDSERLILVAEPYGVAQFDIPLCYRVFIIDHFLFFAYAVTHGVVGGPHIYGENERVPLKLEIIAFIADGVAGVE